ncbi:MAG: fatty acid desaturase [Dongiaceae bacterium]
MEGQESIRSIVGRSQIQALSSRSDRPGLTFLAGHIAALTLTGTLVWLSVGSIWMLPATFSHGIVIVHLFAPFHETCHRTAFRSRWLNTVVSWLTGLVLLLEPLHFKFEHAAHHSFTQHPGKDPQMIPMAENLRGYLLYATSIPYFVGALRQLINHPFGRFTAEERRIFPDRSLAKVRREALMMWGVYLGVAAASVALQTWAALIYWLLPRIVGEPVMRLIRMSEHVGCPRVPNLLRNTRTVLTFAPIRWLAWNNAYHAEHHAIPTVPFFSLPRLHAILGAHIEDVRPGYLNTQLHLIRNGLTGAGAAASPFGRT